MDIRDDTAWLLQSRINPFPVSGSLVLEGGRISFTLDEAAAEASLGWLQKELGADDLTDRLGAGERVVVFDHALEDCVVTWPITGGGAVMIVRTAGRKWVISYDHPSGGRVSQTMGLISGRRRAREWKKALAESGA